MVKVSPPKIVPIIRSFSDTNDWRYARVSITSGEYMEPEKVYYGKYPYFVFWVRYK